MIERPNDTPTAEKRQLAATLLTSQETLERERIAAKKHYDASVRYMEESNFPGMVDELRSSMPDERFPVSFSREIINNRGLAVGVKIVLIWDLAKDFRAIIKTVIEWGGPNIVDEIKDGHKSLKIEFSHDGRIRVRGGWLGSTNLPHAKWKNNPEAAKRALEKAYIHPDVSR